MFFPSAKIIIKDSTNNQNLLLIKRNGYVEPAGGKVEIDFKKRTAETLEQCAVREAREELGVEVEIEGYLGSYYFFWSIDPSRCSICVVFIGNIISTNPLFTTNTDSCEFATEPVWVSIDDVLSKKVQVDPLYKGLEELMLAYCYQLKE